MTNSIINSRLLSTILLIISLFSTIFFIYDRVKTKEEENTNIIITNFGSVNLGKIHSEKVMVKLEIQGLFDDSKGFQEIGFASFFNPYNEISELMESKFEILNSYTDKSSRLKYEEASPKVDMKAKLTTQIVYESSNYDNVPFIFTIESKEYNLEKNKNLKNSIDQILKENFKNNKEYIRAHLFLTNPKDFGLDPSPEMKQ